MPSEETPTAEDDRKTIARHYLRMECLVTERGRSHRTYYVRLAHDAGLTHQEIADGLGIEETTVRELLDHQRQ
ncbi:hypothetical protein [Citricoccus sp.]|uniref:hypothetical protein n=1 Tax=Citricoccus sp. TaxID=1978372 RepID=UPI0028BD780D|nr:hypothetical protein [Citricoccus sp.]